MGKPAIFWTVAWLLGLCAFGGPALALEDDPRAHADYYIDVFGEVSPQADARVQRAYEIFERVRNVAEDPIGFTPALRVIDSDGQPWAVSLPDGYVILSRGALDICYDGDDAEALRVGDARLAFVLGHELAHLVSRDFWHRNVFLSLAGTPNAKALDAVQEVVAGGMFDDEEEREIANIAAIKRKELQADDAGFLYASLAGFETPLIFSHGEESGNSREDFLAQWVVQTRTTDDRTHLGPEERSSFLQSRFTAIVNRVAFFRAGVVLARFGRFRDAQYLFEAFAQSFPSHEVATNLGYVHLQQALQYIPEPLRLRYWLPARLLDAPGVALAMRGLGDALPPAAMRHLREAEKYLKKAAESRLDDVDSRVNLATVYFYLGEFYKARARVEEARALDDSQVDTLVLRALILNEQEKDIDMWPVATRALGKLADKGSPSARYNLARLLEQRGRGAEAREHWLALSQVKGLPSRYRLAVCAALGGKCAPVSDGKGEGLEDRLDPVLRDAFAGEGLDQEDWVASSVQAGPLFVEYFQKGGTDRPNGGIIAIDGRPVTLFQENHEKMPESDLLMRFGAPSETYVMGQREFWRYGQRWGVFLDSGSAVEIWEMAQ